MANNELGFAIPGGSPVKGLISKCRFPVMRQKHVENGGKERKNTSQWKPLEENRQGALEIPTPNCFSQVLRQHKNLTTREGRDTGSNSQRKERNVPGHFEMFQVMTCRKKVMDLECKRKINSTKRKKSTK